MCYQARRTALAKIQTVHVQLWWANLNLENRAWRKVNNRTPTMKAPFPERPRTKFWVQPFESSSVQVLGLAWREAGWHLVPGSIARVLQHHSWASVDYKTRKGLQRSCNSISPFYRWVSSIPESWVGLTSQSETEPESTKASRWARRYLIQ